MTAADIIMLVTGGALFVAMWLYIALCARA